MILDAAWEARHEKALNPLDPREQTSRLRVSTRLGYLYPGRGITLVDAASDTVLDSSSPVTAEKRGLAGVMPFTAAALKEKRANRMLRKQRRRARGH